MKKVRIIQRTLPNGNVVFVIQQKHFLLFWWWVDAWVNSIDGHATDSFSTFEEAQKNLCYFNGSKSTEKIVFESTENGS